MRDFNDTRMHPDYQEPSCWDVIWKLMLGVGIAFAFLGALALIGAAGFLARTWGLA